MVRTVKALRLVAALSLLLGLPPVAAAEDAVHFADANLKAAVEAALGVINPTPAQMADLMSLSAQGRGIGDLTGLEYGIYLTDLDLDENQISDISPLAALTGLTRLYLEANAIHSISPLAGLTNLTDIDLDENQISDISVLAGLTDLADLDVDENQISDISPLAGLTHLVWLDVANNQISDLAPLAGLTHLAWLDAGDNQISDLSPLAGLTDLTELRLSANRISNLSALAGLTHLEGVWLHDNQIRDVAPLAGLTSLTELRLYNNQVNDISAFAALTRLEDAWLHNNRILDLAPLADLTSLTALYLGRNPLNTQACALYIPQILANNPGIDLDYDPCVDACMLTIFATAHGSVPDPGEDSFGYECGTVVSVVAVPESGGTFTGWTGTAVDAGKVADPSSAKTGVTVDGNYTLQANFAGEGGAPQYALTVSAGSGGSVSAPGAGVFTYDGATTVSIAANAFAGYRFLCWTGTAVNAGRVAAPASANTTVTVDGSYTLRADFIREATQVTWYVDAAATGNNDGSSWENAFIYLQEALAKAAKTEEIHVAAGLYRPDLGSGQTLGNRAAAFHLKRGVAIYGGFPAGGGSWEQRNPFLHQSLLSGNIGDPNKTSDNSFHIVTAGGTDKTAILDGCTIMAGYADGPEPQDRGAGLYNLRGSPTIRNCTFLANTALVGNGGGACNIESQATFINCVFNSNTAGNCGGGMSNEGGEVRALNCTFVANQGLFRAGGVFCLTGTTTLTNCILWGNGRQNRIRYDELAQVAGEGMLVIDYCCVQGWSGSFGGEGNWGRDPLFLDADGPDNLAGTPDDDLRLSANSPAIDTGSNAAVSPTTTTDAQGQPRITGGTVDPGAYEYKGE